MNAGALKGFPEQAFPNAVLQSNSNGRIVPKPTTQGSVVQFVKWGY